MKPGPRMYQPAGKIDYKQLRKINPEAARRTALEYLKSWMKVRKLRKLIGAFGCRVIQNHKGHCEGNAHLERSHRTDDKEFYIPRALEIKSEANLLNEAMGYMYYYNNVREHSSLNYQVSFSYLRSQLLNIDDRIRFVIPIMLDKVSVQLGSWSGYNVLVQYLIIYCPHRRYSPGCNF